MPSASEHIGPVGHPRACHLPVETLALRPNNPQYPSILDAVFISRKNRRAAYATTTEASETQVWKVDRRTGRMEGIAKIEWDAPIGGASSRSLPGDGLRSVQFRNKRATMISHGGKTMLVDDFMRKAKGWFPSDSKTFTGPVNGVSYKWKSGPEHSTIPDSTRREIWKRWRCVTANGAPHPTTGGSSNISSSPLSQPGSVPSSRANRDVPPLSPVPSYRSVSSDNSNTSGEMFPLALRSLLRAPASPFLLARFAPPQPGRLKYELILFPAAYPPYSPAPDGMVDTIVVTAVLLASNKNEWKTRQSIMDAQSLAAHFEAEARGAVPPYTPRSPRTIAISARPRTAEERLMDQYVLTMNGTLRSLPSYQHPSGQPPPTPSSPSPYLSNQLRTESDPDLQRSLIRDATPIDSGRSRAGTVPAPSPSRRLQWGSTWIPQRRPRTTQGFERNTPGTPPPSYVQREA